MVLVHQLLDNLPAVVKLVEVVGEHRLLLELVQERVPLLQLVVVPEGLLKEC